MLRMADLIPSSCKKVPYHDSTIHLGTLLLDLISSLLIGLGVIAAFSPLALYW